MQTPINIQSIHMNTQTFYLFIFLMILGFELNAGLILAW
jgi:hypothetical protein